MKAQLEFLEELPQSEHLLVLGRKKQLLSEGVRRRLPPGSETIWGAMVESAGDGGAEFSRRAEMPQRLGALRLPEECSRHNCPARAASISRLLKEHLPSTGSCGIILALDKAQHGRAAAFALARVLPLYQRKSSIKTPPPQISVIFLVPEGPTVDEPVLEICESIRLAAELVDRPCSELDTTAFVELARGYAAQLGVGISVIEGEDVAHAGLGGLWAVGKAAEHPPALVILDYSPKFLGRNAPSTVWVGKGIVYDTGGLTLKSKTGMPGMKGDMAGAAAVLGAFIAAVRLKIPRRIRALLCLAENAVGPKAMRPDDILTLYSGRTVELNNTDAEGRLVLADGVSYAARHLGADLIIDIATLTGAQLMATGKQHAAIYTNDPSLEDWAVRAGRRCGDLVFPVPYAPELFRKEFKSQVADMKNSVKDRMNAQVSCAAQFVGEHLGDYQGRWLHIDMAGPATKDDRGTGYGVALLIELFKEL